MGKTNRRTPQGSKLPDGARHRKALSDAQSKSGVSPREIQISKKLSWLLRHGADKEGLKLGPGGYINVADVLSHNLFKSAHVNFEEVKKVVAGNEKKRFGLLHLAAKVSFEPQPATEESPEESQASDVKERGGAQPAADAEESIPPPIEQPDINSDPAEELPESSTTASTNPTSTAPSTDDAISNPDTNPSHYLIRANQGHSIKLPDTSDLLTPITLDADNLPSIVVHGTRHEVWPDILASGGLKPIRRNHVHFATGVPKQLQSNSQISLEKGEVPALAEDQTKTPEVLSGMRGSSTVLIFLDLRKALEGGIEFFVSENGVVLTEGGENGLVPIEYFQRVEEKGGRALVEDGKVVAEIRGLMGSAGKKKQVKPSLNKNDGKLGLIL